MPDLVAVLEHDRLELTRELPAALRAALGDDVVDRTEMHERPQEIAVAVEDACHDPDSVDDRLAQRTGGDLSALAACSRVMTSIARACTARSRFSLLPKRA